MPRTPRPMAASTRPLLIAMLAAVLALSEQQAKKAEIAVQENSILAADAWNQYQAKSVRAALAQDLARLGATLDQPVQAELVAERRGVLRQFQADLIHYEADGKDGKTAIAARAQAFEAARQARARAHPQLRQRRRGAGTRHRARDRLGGDHVAAAVPVRRAFWGWPVRR